MEYNFRSQLESLIFIQGEVEHINQSVPWLEEEEQSTIDAMKSPRILKTHDKWSWVPKGDCVRYIYCIRNPKDVCCSYYNHMSKVFIEHYNYQGTLNEFYHDVFIKPGKSEQGWYFDHLRDWLDQKGNPNIHFLFFEDMVEDLKREIQKLIGFLNVECSKDKLDRIVQSSKFDSMTTNNAVNYSWRNGSFKDSNSKFLKSGKVGTWTNHLSEVQSDEICKLAKELIEIPYGFKFRYML